MPAGDTTPAPSTNSDLSRSVDERDATAARTRADLGTMIPEGPTSVDEEYELGGWNKRSPQDSRSGYNAPSPGQMTEVENDSNDN